MLRKLDLFIPGFLKKLDRHLLLHRPGLWSSRIHYVLFFGLIALGIAILRATVLRVQPSDVPNPEIGFAILTIPALAALVFWAWQLSMFSLEKRHGILQTGFSLQNQLVFAVGVVLFAMLPFSYSSITADKARKVVPKHELIQDVNALNLGSRYFPGDYAYTPYAEQDLLIQFWVHPNDMMNLSDIQALHAQQQRSRSLVLDQIADYMAAFQKYGGALPAYQPQEVLAAYERKMPISPTYREQQIVRQNLQVIAQAQNGTLGFQDEDFLHGSVFLIFFLWLSLMIFHKVHWKRFMFTAIVGAASLVGGVIFTVVVSEVFHVKDVAPSCMLFVGALVFLLVQAYRRTNTRKLNAWKSIAMSLATLMTPMVPMVMLLMVDHNFSDASWYGSMYLGLMITLITWNIAYQRRFIELQSMPQEN